MGPVILFDKSTLESLSINESVWLDAHYNANITPLFFVETLADLQKVTTGRTAEQIVGNLAEKTPEEGQPNVHHVTLCWSEMHGVKVEMVGSIILAGGEPVESEGRRGVVIKESPEMSALRRWERREFLEIERQFAQIWRKALSGLDLNAVYQKGKEIIRRHGRPRDLAEAKDAAAALHAKQGSRYTREALQGFPLSEQERREITERWKAAGEPPINRMAPFTAHVLTVDSFFTIALGADLISRDRPSNKVDIAYLYYLPFCMVFTSSDNLHARTAPLFLSGERHVFVRGQELKADLAALDAHYWALPDDVKERGVMSFARYPPTEGDFLTSRLWDKLMKPDWRDDAREPGLLLSKEDEQKLIDQMSRMADAPRAGRDFTRQETNATIVQRTMSSRKGKWRLVPPEVEKNNGGKER